MNSNEKSITLKSKSTILETITSNNEKSIQLQQRRQTPKKRVRRYLSFPEGASFTCAICATIGIIGNIDPSYMSFGLNWGLAYDLPNSTWILNKFQKFKKHRINQEPVIKNEHDYHIPDHNHFHDDYYYDKATKAISKRETRRSFYKEIEFFIEKTMGYNGKDCILRALCESAQFFTRKTKKTMLEEIVRTIFSLPKTKLFSFEPSDFEEYDEAYRTGDKIDDCSLIYDGCNFSLLDLAFGKYSEPPPSHLPQPKFSSTYDPLATPVKFN
ncbi:uncharacterized protein LOC129618511 [Condylostylus longicornis]|uniref:uncharacterized protein LOC129618511 n=1 Tax=Condylostylus longicornis TaxID=2530218 RepID=UPI00244DD54C|nr:uncharacterized protein LOC129618511 [Condylostylus longicornis]